MIEALKFTAGVMFWSLVVWLLVSVWAELIGGFIRKIIGKKKDD